MRAVSPYYHTSRKHTHTNKTSITHIHIVILIYILIYTNSTMVTYIHIQIYNYTYSCIQMILLEAFRHISIFPSLTLLYTSIRILLPFTTDRLSYLHTTSYTYSYRHRYIIIESYDRIRVEHILLCN